MGFEVAAARVMGEGAFQVWAPSGAAPPVEPPEEPTVFVEDTMAGSAAAELSTRTGETGATWTQHPSIGTGRGLISDAGRLYAGTGTGVLLYYASGVPGDADYSVEADIWFETVQGSSSMGICGRMDTTANTFYNWRYQQLSAGWVLSKWVAGTSTNFQIVGTTPSVDTIYHLELRMIGDQISGWVDGVQVTTTHTDAAITAAGRAGIRGGGAIGSNTVGPHLDNFVATN